jgi:hypothetical protein
MFKAGLMPAQCSPECAGNRPIVFVAQFGIVSCKTAWSVSRDIGFKVRSEKMSSVLHQTTNPDALVTRLEQQLAAAAR